MIVELVRNAGPWAWWIFGAVLLIAEIILPGNVLIWVGVAAVATGLLSNLLWATSWWTWEVQWLVFAALSTVSLFVGRSWLKGRGGHTEEPTLNNRGASLVGRTADLIDPISNGRGRVKIGDTVWIVTGPDLPQGAKVRVTGSKGNDLEVVAA